MYSDVLISFNVGFCALEQHARSTGDATHAVPHSWWQNLLFFLKEIFRVQLFFLFNSRKLTCHPGDVLWSLDFFIPPHFLVVLEIARILLLFLLWVRFFRVLRFFAYAVRSPYVLDPLWYQCVQSSFLVVLRRLNLSRPIKKNWGNKRMRKRERWTVSNNLHCAPPWGSDEEDNSDDFCLESKPTVS